MKIIPFTGVLLLMWVTACQFAGESKADKDNPGKNVVGPIKVMAFSTSDVRLKPSRISQSSALNIKYLHKLDPDRLLHNFRVNAGLPSSVKPLEGWESPDCGLRGHFTGHYLSACASVIKNEGDSLLAKRIGFMINMLRPT